MLSAIKQNLRSVDAVIGKCITVGMIEIWIAKGRNTVYKQKTARRNTANE